MNMLFGKSTIGFFYFYFLLLVEKTLFKKKKKKSTIGFLILENESPKDFFGSSRGLR